MNKEQKIKEMAIFIYTDMDECCRFRGVFDCANCNCNDNGDKCVIGEHIAETLYNAGYRKESETASKIYESIKGCLDIACFERRISKTTSDYINSLLILAFREYGAENCNG